MSNDRFVYVGTYLKVWMPKIEEKSRTGTCSQCDSVMHYSKFCPHCGSPIVFGTIERMSSFYDFAEEIFGEDEADSLFSQDMEDDFYLIFPNHSEMKCGEHVGTKAYYEEDLETPIPEEGFKHEAWGKLTANLWAKGIAYEICYGIVNYVEH